MKYYILAIAVALSLITLLEEKQNPLISLDKEKVDKINHLGNRYLDLNRFSGSILIIQNDTEIYFNHFGLADYEAKTKFTQNTAFKIGDVSSLVTKAILNDYITEGKLNPASAISDILPEINADFTIHDIHNGNAILPSIQHIKKENPDKKYSIIELINLGINTSNKLKNSDLSSCLLGLVLEKVSGKNFQEIISSFSKKHHLENTYFKKLDSTLAKGYLFHNYQGKGLELQIAPEYNEEEIFCNNGIKSTIKDLAKIFSFIPEKSIKMHGYIANDGFSYSVEKNTVKGYTVIVLSNRRHPITDEISNSIHSILTGKEHNLPLLRKPVIINTQLFSDYVGKYAINENVSFDVVTERDSLFVLMGPNRVPIIPQSDNQFYMLQNDAAMRFLRSNKNEVNEVMLLNGFIEGETAKRINE